MNKKIFYGIVVFFLGLLTHSCNESNTVQEKEKELILTIASSRTEKNSMEETPGYAFIYYVKNETSEEWQPFPYEIIDFNYEEGYEYIIKIKEIEVQDPPQDHPAYLYQLIELIGKEPKSSDNSLPSYNYFGKIEYDN